MGGIGSLWYSSLTIAPFCNCGSKVAVVTQSRWYPCISGIAGSKVVVVTRYRWYRWYWWSRGISGMGGIGVTVVSVVFIPYNSSTLQLW